MKQQCKRAVVCDYRSMIDQISISFSLCVVCAAWVCVYDFFLYIFSLWYTYELANKMADRSHILFQLNSSQTQRNFSTLASLLILRLPTHKHTRAFMTYAYKCARARTQHAQMKMRNEIRKTSTMIKKELKKIHSNSHTKLPVLLIWCIYIIFITANQLIFCPHRRVDRYKRTHTFARSDSSKKWLNRTQNEISGRRIRIHVYEMMVGETVCA